MAVSEINLLEKKPSGRKNPESGEKLLRAEIKKIIESLLFSSNEPLSLPQIKEVIDNVCRLKLKVLEAIVKELQMDYERSDCSFRINEIADGYLLRTLPKYGEYIGMLHNKKRMEKLSRAATEVLAIIAYRQPVTRMTIEGIRGVDSSGVLQVLLERELVEFVGKLDAPGKPSLYGTTHRFLSHYGLKDLKEFISEK